MSAPHLIMNAVRFRDSDVVAATLDGEARAIRADAAKFGDPDAIARAIANVMAEDGYILPITPRLLGFSRAIRKMLEAAR